MQRKTDFFTTTQIFVVILSILVMGCSTSTNMTELASSPVVPSLEAATPTTAITLLPNTVVPTLEDATPTLATSALTSPVAPTLMVLAPTATASVTVTVAPEETEDSNSSPSQPVIINTYPVQTIYPGNKGGGEGTLLALEGQVWTGTLFGGLQQWDPKTGRVVKTLLSNVPPRLFYDLEFDGQNLWVLSNDQPGQDVQDSVYVISPSDGEILKKIDVEEGGGVEEIGLSPGKAWIGSSIYDTGTLEPDPVAYLLPDESRFAYDGERWMWITGVNCHGCEHDLWIYDTSHLPDHKDAENSGTLKDGVLGSQPHLAGGKMWLVVRSGGEPVYFLDAYDLQRTDRPLLQIDLMQEFQDTDTQSSQVSIAADNHVLWLSLVGRLYYFDLETGQESGSLAIGEHVMGMGFDGESLWLLSNDDGLIQVSIPWER